MPPAVVEVSSSLSAELTNQLRRRTQAEIRFDPGSRAIYASDLSHYRQVPIGAVIPRTLEDVIETVAVCREYGIPIFGRGAGTSLAGQTCNAAVVLDFSKYVNRLLELNPKERYAWVEPGLINDQLRQAAEQHSLTFAPDPATHAYCTLGGMIGNNSCGAHSVLGGKTSENIEELDILTYDGLRLTVGATSDRDYEKIQREGGRPAEIYRRLRALRDTYADEVRRRFPDIPRRVSGYNLDYLLPENNFHLARALVGSESTCVLVLRAKTKLIHSPQHRVLLVIAYPDVATAGDHSYDISKLDPIAIEGFERRIIENEQRKGKPLPGLKLFPKGGAWLLVEFGADSEAKAIALGEKARRWVESHDRDHLGLNLLIDKNDQHNAMDVRERGLGATRVPGVMPETWPGWEDAAVPPAKLGDYLRDFDALCKRYNYYSVIYGHFGQGCIHARLDFDLKSAEGVAKYRRFVTEAAHIVTGYGGSLSGEHGDGQSRAELLPIMFGPRLIEAFREFKHIWDPGSKMNPGKLVDPYPLDSNLRTGPDYKPKPVLTIFQFPEDHGSMAEATERCFGVGKCRKLEGGTMCPSFQVTREEEHSTRGRARMLFEMLRGDVIDDGWRDPHIKDALDLCLACKGCKGDCPVSVDVATYKAEFLAHFYEGRVRPAAAYSMGLIDRWAQIASRAPALVNLATQTPGISSIAKKIGGITQHRDMPAFPPQTFKRWFAQRDTTSSSPMNVRGEVILWADTFNNYLFPHTAKAAVEVLEDAGFRVRVPQQHLCCGRPLYDFGMLDLAKSYLRSILTMLAPEIAAGTPIVCLEPSCASVFHDELVNLFPKEDAAHRLRKQIMLLPDFLDEVGYKPSQQNEALRGRKAVIHGHCHHKALWSMSPEQKLLREAGLEPELLDSGCCGLAGSFGYEPEHFDISMKIGERVLFPRVRSSDHDTLIVADGFSCRQQIAHGTPRRALHLAEVLQMALKPKPAHRSRRTNIEAGHTEPGHGSPVLALLAIAGLASAAGIYLLARNRRTPSS
ncbi:MAG TPA: FAD-linked oxidase C-terminal domain-containing protein [Acidobacteriaceae bacterium]|jgi:FAD/FMN-containing dehydrogenase/Fe-S oxidoreductase|nr:FAD-linked oxidase C-terminal domain-containing protein [Acidobacteriaceae bacterium]